MDTESQAPDVEQFDQLLPYLRQHGLLAPDEETSCQRLTGGVSNKTVRVQRAHPPHLVVKQALPKLRVAVDWFSSPLRIHQEYAALGVFARILPQQVPQALFQDRTCHVIVMTEVPGPYVNWKTMMLQGDVQVRYWQEFGRMLARLHNATADDPEAIPRKLHDRTYFRSLRLEPYYDYAGTRIPEAQPFLHALVQETLSQRLSLVHGDYSPKNILIADDRLFLLDFEVCHVGDPAFDVGFALTHALSKGHYLTRQRQRLQQASIQFWQTYRATTGTGAFGSDMEERCIRHTLGCLLARVAGRSPLEYLDEHHRATQMQAVQSLLVQPPCSLLQLIQTFLAYIGR